MTPNDLKAYIFSRLNGILDNYPTNYRGFDIQCNDFIIELDEERHFNRYRLLTLKSQYYKDHKLFDTLTYKDLCQTREEECLKAACWRKNWENDSTKKQFGKSDDEGYLGTKGSSRWKQRAFYDYLRDISSTLMSIPIIRISIWEKIGNTTIDHLIKIKDFKKIENLILERIG